TRAEIAVRNQQPQEAQRLIVEARAKYDQGMAAFPAIWQQLGKRESFYALSGDGLTQLRQIGGILHLKEIAVAGRLGRNPTVQKKATLTGGRPELVTIGLYNPPGGLMFGAKGLQDLLSGIADFRLEVLSDLQMSTLKKYSVVVFPDCKRFGQPTPQVEELREFVFDYGGGIYFEHDSCGYQRFPLQTGIFPEMGELQQMVGKLLRAKDYDPADRQLRIRADGRIFQQCYLDHCVFENCRPEHVWVEDLQGRPVWLAAPLGNGRVVYNGGITYAEDDSEIAASAIGPDERKLILQAVRWASGKSGHQAKILNVKKSEEVQTDAIRDVISFNLYLHPAAPIENASLTAECYRSRDRLKLQTVARLRLPERLDEEWESEELFQVATVPAEEIILVLTLNDLHGQVSWEFPVQ
ncbi:MAG: hypothetical protein GX564_02055, partial [Oligosphaeraceae bacterium]|nr:hypothetical protein [Oligosphaeraceae bacterium]